MSLLDVIDSDYNQNQLAGSEKPIFACTVTYKLARHGGQSWFKALSKAVGEFVLSDVLLNFLINLLVLGLLAGRSPFPLFTGTLDRTAIDPTKLKEAPIPLGKQVKPVLTAKLHNRVICDGEYLLVRNTVPIQKLITLLILVISISVVSYQLFLHNYLHWVVQTLLAIGTYCVFSLIPERTFSLFDRRKFVLVNHFRTLFPHKIHNPLEICHRWHYEAFLGCST